MLHLTVARTAFATAARKYGPSVMRMANAYRTSAHISRKRSASHQDKGNLLSYGSRSGTVPTQKEWWQ